MCGVKWTDEQHEEAVRLRNEGLSCDEIAAKLGRTRGSVGKRLQGLWNGPRGDDWTSAQVDHLSEHLHVPAALLVAPLSKLGPHRSLSAIRSKKRGFSDYTRPSRGRNQHDELSWPSMSGSHEERDAQFAIRVIEAKHFCGLIRDRRLVELMIDDVKRSLSRRKEAA